MSHSGDGWRVIVDTEIVVSGRRVKIPGDQISYDDVVEIWNRENAPQEILGTPGIEYRNDALGQSGILKPGESIGVKDGTSFKVDPQHVS